MGIMKKLICVFCVALLCVMTFASCSDEMQPEEVLTDVSEAEIQSEEFSAENASTKETTVSETTTEETTVAEITTETTTAITTTVFETTTSSAGTASVGSFSASDIGCTINGVYIQPNTKWSNYSSAFGPASNEIQAPSCHFDGMDTIYEYNGFAIYTYLNNGEAYVYDIEITTSAIKTNKGITVGSSAQDVIDAYGTGYSSISDYLIAYTQGAKSIYFSLSNGKVCMIEFYCA